MRPSEDWGPVALLFLLHIKKKRGSERRPYITSDWQDDIYHFRPKLQPNKDNLFDDTPQI